MSRLPVRRAEQDMHIPIEFVADVLVALANDLLCACAGPRQATSHAHHRIFLALALVDSMQSCQVML